jgi:hypothetical protein
VALNIRVESNQRMTGKENSEAINKHFELQIQTLQNAPRFADKLKVLFEIKTKTKGGTGNAHRRYTRVSDTD